MKYVWWFFTGLLLAAAWLINQGFYYLEGPSQTLLEKLASAKGLIPEWGPLSGYSLPAKLSGDPLLVSSTLQGLTVLLGIAACWWALSKVWANPISPTLTTGLAFFGGSTLWVAATEPGDGMAALFKALAIAAIVSGKVPILFGAVLALGYLEPATGVSLLLVLIYLAVRRVEAYGLFICFLAVFSGGLLMVGMVGDYALAPSLKGLSGWTLLPLIALATSTQIRIARKELYAVMLVASALTGASEFASLICIGDIFVVALRPSEEGESSEISAKAWRLSRSKAIQVAAIVLFVAAILPGEQHLNRRVLIPAQKKKVGIGQLFLPFSLRTHAERLTADRWRPNTPFPEMSAQELELLKGDGKPFRLLTLDKSVENRKLSLLYALWSGRQLTGWDGPKSLSASSLICKAASKNVMEGADNVVLLRHGDNPPSLEAGMKLPDDTKSAKTSRAWGAPLQQQKLSEDPGKAYRLRSLTEAHTFYFADQPALLVFSAFPNVYLVGGLDSEEKLKEYKVNNPKLSLKAPSFDAVLPSRTLIPVSFTLTNDGETPITTDEIAGITLTTDRAADTTFLQDFAEDFVLFPKESVEVSLQLATPSVDGTYELVAAFQTLNGATHKLPITSDPTIRTWRRIAPVGTWVEEPPTP